MANRNLNHPWAYQKMLTFIRAKLVLANGGAITSSNSAGQGFTVVKTSTGLYTFTFDDQFVDLINFDASLVEPVAGLTTLAVRPLTAYTTATGKGGTAGVQVVNSSAVAADVAQVCELHVSFDFKNTSVPR